MTSDLIDTCFLFGDNSFIISVNDYFILGSICHGQPKVRVRLFYNI